MRLIFFLGFKLLCFFSFPVFSFEFTPSVVSYQPHGREATQKYTAYNSQENSIAVEISASLRLVDENGIETLQPTKDFRIYPQLFKLKPGESRVVKVTYVGEKDIATEVAYRIVAEQLSIDFKKASEIKEKKVSINFMMKYETSAFVVGGEGQAKIEFLNFSEVRDDKKAKFLAFTVKNSGSRHQVFANWQLVLKSKDGRSVTLATGPKKDIPEFNVLAGKQINLKIPWPSQLEGIPVAVDYKFESD